MRKSIEQAVTTLQQGVLYTSVIAFLALGSVGLLILEVLYDDVYPHLVPISQNVDLAIAWIFLTDFFAGLLFNRELNAKTYWKQNWLNLVSSIPVTSEITRTLRILRLLRAFRVLRAATNFWFAEQRAKRNYHNNHS